MMRFVPDPQKLRVFQAQVDTGKPPGTEDWMVTPRLEAQDSADAVWTFSRGKYLPTGHVWLREVLEAHRYTTPTLEPVVTLAVAP